MLQLRNQNVKNALQIYIKMTIEQKTEARKKLKTALGAGVTSLISENTGVSKVYIRRWFTEDFAQPSIEAEVIELLQAVAAKENSLRELLN